MAVKTWTGEQLLSGDINNYLTNAGTVYVAQQTVSAVGTVDFDDVFTSTYISYRIVLTGTCSAATNLTAQLQVAGTAAATNYYWGGQQTTVTGAAAVTAVNGGGSTTSWRVGSLTTTRGGLEIVVHSPQLAAYTGYTSQNAYNTSDYRTFGGIHATATAYDGILLSAGANTFTGTVTIYGHRIA